MTPTFVTEPLGRQHDRSTFRSGSEELDRYFRERVSQDVRRRVASCFVAVDEGGTIAGFYTLAASSVSLNELPPEAAKGLPRYPVVPVILIGRLAVAMSFQGRGMGGSLIADAIGRIDQLDVGAYAIIVDAKDDSAQRFYERHGFVLLPGGGRRLFVPVETALRALRGK